MASPMTPATEQPGVALPAGKLLGAALAASLAAGGLFAAASWATGRGEPAAGLGAAAIVAACTVGSLVAITPWKRRPVQLWMSMWLGQMLLRLVVTPIATYLLYSATSLAALPLAVGITYFVTVVSEAVVLKRCLVKAAA